MNTRLRELLDLYLTDKATSQEKDEFYDYISDPLYANELQELLADAYEQEHTGVETTAVQRQTILNHIFTTETISRPAKTVRLWPRIAVAAAMIVAIFGAGLLYYSLHNGKAHPDLVVLKNDIAPGQQGATLTLANGKKIRLSDAANGELAEEAGVVISKSADGQLMYEKTRANADADKMNTLSTANGETYKLRLPDGSLVWLNAGSSLTYAASLNEHGTRRVQLTGEGYFEIAQDDVHPFVVTSKGQEVQVLGTHFNINAYADEPSVATTLLEGAVKINAGADTRILKPNEQALNNGSSIDVVAANLENITDWKNGDFYLNRINFKTAMRKIARWYDVDVVFDVPIADDIESGGWVSRNNKLSAVLNALQATGLARFKVENKTIHVYK